MNTFALFLLGVFFTIVSILCVVVAGYYALVGRYYSSRYRTHKSFKVGLTNRDNKNRKEPISSEALLYAYLSDAILIVGYDNRMHRCLDKSHSCITALTYFSSIAVFGFLMATLFLSNC